MLVNSLFSFSPKSFQLFKKKKISQVGSYLRFSPFPNKPWILHVCSTSLMKTLWEKEKLLVISNFSFSQCFQPLCRTPCTFHEIQNCRLQTLSVWKCLNLSFGKDLPYDKNLTLTKLKTFAEKY